MEREKKKESLQIEWNKEWIRDKWKRKNDKVKYPEWRKNGGRI